MVIDQRVVLPHLEFAHCERCGEYSHWLKGKMIYPSRLIGPPPNEDMPKDIERDYDEARSISSASPRGAAALLRLVIQKLCIHLGEKGEDLNTDIAKLVKKGLPEKIQKSLDSVRVIGNEAVHPGLMDLKDDTETVGQLFALINLIADVMITKPKAIDDLYRRLPESKREAIEKRDRETRSEI